MHLVLGVVRVQLHGAAGVLQGVHTFAKALIGQRREIVPPRIAAGHAVQYAARLGVAAIGHKVAGGLHLRGVGAGGTGPGLLIAAKAKTEAKGVEALKPVKAIKAGVTVILLAVVLLTIALPVVTLLLVAAVGVAAHLGAGIALGNGIVGGLHLLEVLLGRGVVGVQIRVPALALGAVCFFDLVVACAALNAQHLIGISHARYTSSLIILTVQHRCTASVLFYRNIGTKSRRIGLSGAFCVFAVVFQPHAGIQDVAQ